MMATSERQITGQELKIRRMSLGLTRKEVAEEAGYTASWLNTLEYRTHPHAESAATVMAAMDRLQERFQVTPIEGQVTDRQVISVDAKRQIQYLYLFCGWSNDHISNAMGIRYEAIRDLTKHLERFS